MANQLDGSKRSNQIYELDSIRYLREEDAADIFGLPYSTVLYFAQAAGAVYQLRKLTLATDTPNKRLDGIVAEPPLVYDSKEKSR